MGKPPLHFILGACLAVSLIAGHAAPAPKDTETSQYAKTEIWLQRSRDDYVVKASYYLVPAPPGQVKNALAKALAATGSGSYAWKDDSAPLWSMDATWIDVSRQAHPDVNRALEALAAGAVRDTLRQALAAGVVTPEENAAYEKAARMRTRFGREEIQAVPFFAQRIERWTFDRARRPLIGADYEDGGGLMDVSAMLGGAPMTLVWFDGVRTTEHRALKLTSCMTGVTCFPDPHIERWKTATPHIDAATDRAIHTAVAGLGALPAAAADARMTPFLRLVPPEPAGRTVEAASAPVETLAAYDLPADETDVHRYDDNTWRLVGLKGGDVMVAGARSRRYALRDGAIRTQDVGARFGEDGIRAQADGAIRGVRSDGAQARLIVWSPKDDDVRSTPLPMLQDRSAQDWAPQPSGMAAIRTENAIYLVDPRTQAVRTVSWDERLRAKVSDSLDDALPWAGTQAIRFNDGLLWRADRGAYGISPATGKAVASFATDTPKLFFGSRDGDWAIARLDRGSGDARYRIVSPRTGQVRFDLKAAQPVAPASVARSAHGRLLAISSDVAGGPSTAVVDMQNGKVVATLATPGAYRVKAAAFSWQGTRLWLYLESADMRTRKLARWDVPQPYADAADGRAVPDQMRCLLVRGENCGNY
ncbi:hypothetical protein CAL29_23155 [Bordetella genomosp. 10]|uniref:Uncharacterized protein n=1 Tax=Bordetella genomosp. 10 TaxID=1416804 RepID=A0A261S1P8_9BORD|nr:hypothetical protein [Bordetella genomosp. 10]OZI30872.1 hypothetical protein CAL29_23155 [Bordetella genomosp. 10]